MADVFPEIFRLAAFFFYDVGLEHFSDLTLAIHSYFTSFLSYHLSVSRFLNHSEHHSL